MNSKTQDQLIDELVELQNELIECISALELMEWDSNRGKIKIKMLLKDISEIEAQLD